MLCPVCDVDSTGESCSGCGGALALNGRFRLERLLGKGGQSRVYTGRDGSNGGPVAVKIMSLDRVREWKNVELFRRAAEVLAGLHHPGIPKLVEYFEEKRPNALLLCLVHELIDGQTLAEAQKHGLRFDEPSARALLVELLGILDYLQSLSPPVIHRDLKPSNLMRRRDGRLVLIDFDLVRDVMMPGGGETTTAGTAGYTPIEQYAGEAVPASDLYAAGATLAALLSRKEPLELRAAGEQRLALADHIHVGARFLAVLDRMVEPDLKRRYQTASEVLADLQRPEKPANPPRPAWALPLVLVVMLSAFAGALLFLTQSAPTPPAAAPPAPPARLVPPIDPTPPVAPPAPLAPARAAPAIARTPEAIAAALRGPTWEGTVETTRIQLRFSGSGAKLKGQLSTFSAAGNARTVVPVKVEIATLGTITLRARSVEDGVAVERTFYGELAGGSISGTSETRYDSGGSSYITDGNWLVKGTP